MAKSAQKSALIKGDRRYRGKALVIFGWNDMISLSTATQYAQAFRRAEVKGILQCGHYPEIDNRNDLIT